MKFDLTNESSLEDFLSAQKSGAEITFQKKELNAFQKKVVEHIKQTFSQIKKTEYEVNLGMICFKIAKNGDDFVVDENALSVMDFEMAMTAPEWWDDIPCDTASSVKTTVVISENNNDVVVDVVTKTLLEVGQTVTAHYQIADGTIAEVSGTVKKIIETHLFFD
jgi:hypothetical protein